MKRTYIFILSILVGSVAFAQENAEKKDPVIKISGHIRYEGYMDTYQSVTTRDGDIYLYPERSALNNDKTDFKAYNQFNMLSAQSRLRAKINGPDAFGAKVNGTAELDFLGKAEGLEQTPRIRHMFMNLSWEKAQLTLGQTWHPVFATECFPQVLSMGAALPFQALNRAPQIRLTYKISDNIHFVGSASSHKDHASKGAGAAQKNAVLPDFHFQLKYKSGNVNAGVIGGYRFYKPRTMLADSTITNVAFGSYDVAAFLKVKANDLTFKLYGIYGENLSSYVMIGGYGASENPNPAAADYVEDYNYSNINSMSVWTELMYKSGAVGYGIFAGYSANLGTSEENYYDIKATRSDNIANIMRVSPRVTFTSGKVMFGLEYMMTSATYTTLANNGKYEAAKDSNNEDIIDDPVSNNRIQISAKYTF